MSEEFENALSQEIATATRSAVPPPPHFTTFASLGPLLPEEQDPSVLFRGNWLGHGGGLLVTASSGVGKSSLVAQALFCWSLGKDFLASPMRPLKCALVQSEDSRRDLQEIRDGMVAGFKANGWQDETIARALNAVHIWSCVGKVGREFCTWLLGQQRQDPVDLIAINPVQGFFGGDISKQEDVSRFLREGIDPILKGEFGTQPCASILVQHTPKITSGQGEGRANVNDYGEYIGAGSHEWTDWCRAKLVFLKRKSSDIYFDLKAAKRGKRLRWAGKDAEPTTNRLIAHSDGYIFWRIVDDLAEIERVENATRPESHPSHPSKPPSALHEKRRHDKGARENALTLVDAVKGHFKTDTKIDNNGLRQWADAYWVRDVARKAVTDFEEIRQAHCIRKDEHGFYVLAEGDCQNAESTNPKTTK